MSDSDSFINEVSEEVRRDRMYALWRRWGPYVIGGVVAVVALAGGKAWLDAKAVQDARDAGAAMIAVSETAPTEAAEALTTLADNADDDGVAVLARLRAAGAFAADGRAEDAAKAYEIVAADDAADPILKDFAAFRAVAERTANMAPMARADALTPIADGNGAFRLLALEAKGAALLAAGDREAAAEAMRAVVADEATPQGLRQRVEAVLTAIGAADEATG